MKEIIVHSNYDILNKNNNLFNNIGDVSVKDFLNQMYELKMYGLENDINLVSSDGINIQVADSFIFIDMPEINNRFFKKAVSTGKPIYLLAWESGIINPRNSNRVFHDHFRAVFTYDDTLIDNKKYFKVAYSFVFPEKIPKKYLEKKLCCLIVGNKASTHTLELYSRRLEVINWFEDNHPDEFDLYGQGWTKIIPPKNIIDRVINKFSFFNKYFKPKHISYRGEIIDKKAVYEKYLFSICFENAKDLPGYITEKIFDCFFAGCVPIYWGANNISDYIPPTCYIDMRAFLSIEMLYHYLKRITERKYYGYLNSIEEFVQKNKKGIFSTNYFSRTIMHKISEGIS